jgi:hypothetical protein
MTKEIPMPKRKNPDAPYHTTLLEAEKQMIEWYLGQTNGHVAEAARLLGIDTSFLYRRMKKLDVAKSGGTKPEWIDKEATADGDDDAIATEEVPETTETANPFLQKLDEGQGHNANEGQEGEPPLSPLCDSADGDADDSLHAAEPVGDAADDGDGHLWQGEEPAPRKDALPPS